MPDITTQEPEQLDSAEIAPAAERIHAFMQAWCSGQEIATAVSHGDGRQRLTWDDLRVLLVHAEAAPPRATVEDVALVPDDQLRPLLAEALQLLDAAERSIDTLQAGADPTPLPAGAHPTPGQWVHGFLGLDADRRHQVAARLQDAADRGYQCFAADHEGRLGYLQAAVDSARAQLEAVRGDLALARHQHARAGRELAATAAERDEALVLARSLYPAPVDVPGGAG